MRAEGRRGETRPKRTRSTFRDEADEGKKFRIAKWALSAAGYDRTFFNTSELLLKGSVGLGRLLLDITDTNDQLL